MVFLPHTPFGILSVSGRALNSPVALGFPRGRSPQRPETVIE